MKLAELTTSTIDAAMGLKIPLWQALLLGGTTYLASRLLLARTLHTTAPTQGSKRAAKAGQHEQPAEDTKLVLVVRTDLGMTKGKIAAQCCHATLACYKRAMKEAPGVLKAWEYSGQAKVTLKCASEEELLALLKAARERGLVAQAICDAGRTQIAAGSRTVLGVGPGPISVIDSVCGHLKLY
ncbi:hypothetical protein LPJ56_007154 [Coemansia sp. RSA 2599]|nr:hypothetical protein LPJ75_007225 [Coemansia sp. RSA 2598]KAJ1802617.1 hypothetical protein LPJ56_007154 [Coemansia sp. RSA 2599]